MMTTGHDLDTHEIRWIYSRAWIVLPALARSNCINNICSHTWAFVRVSRFIDHYLREQELLPDMGKRQLALF
jgi:hypothetical protein